MADLIKFPRTPVYLEPNDPLKDEQWEEKIPLEYARFSRDGKYILFCSPNGERTVLTLPEAIVGTSKV